MQQFCLALSLFPVVPEFGDMEEGGGMGQPLVGAESYLFR